MYLCEFSSSVNVLSVNVRVWILVISQCTILDAYIIDQSEIQISTVVWYSTKRICEEIQCVWILNKSAHRSVYYGVALISRLLQNYVSLLQNIVSFIGLFCKRDL